jgi:hypothetical protein
MILMKMVMSTYLYATKTIILYVDGLLAALVVLPLILPDVRTKPSSESMIYFSNMKVRNRPIPVLIVTVSHRTFSDQFKQQV